MQNFIQIYFVVIYASNSIGPIKILKHKGKHETSVRYFT